MSAHARLGPSSASRWLSCPASVNMCEQVPKRGGGAAAQAGTIMHAVFERIMLGQDHIREDECDELTDLDWDPSYAVKLIDQSIVAARAALKRYGLSEFLTETRVNPGVRFGRSDLWGTADLIAADERSGILLVGDLKTGRGRVDVNFNDQMLTYAVGALDIITFVPKRIVLAIFQPVVLGTNPGLFETDMATIREFEEFLRTQAALTDVPDLEPTPDDYACRWCPAKPICKFHATPA